MEDRELNEMYFFHLIGELKEYAEKLGASADIVLDGNGGCTYTVSIGTE